MLLFDVSKKEWSAPAAPTPFHSPRWSPDSKRIAYKSGKGTCVYDVDRARGEIVAADGDTVLGWTDAEHVAFLRLTRAERAEEPEFADDTVRHYDLIVFGIKDRRELAMTRGGPLRKDTAFARLSPR